MYIHGEEAAKQQAGVDGGAKKKVGSGKARRERAAPIRGLGPARHSRACYISRSTAVGIG